MKLNHFHSPVVALTSIAVAAILVGCSTTDSKLWQVAPNYRISNTGASAEMGYTALARQYEGERRWAEAANAWRKAAAAAPQDAEILNSLGLAEARQGRFANANALGLSANRKVQDDELPERLDWRTWLEGWKAARNSNTANPEPVIYQADVPSPLSGAGELKK